MYFGSVFCVILVGTLIFRVLQRVETRPRLSFWGSKSPHLPSPPRPVWQGVTIGGFLHFSPTHSLMTPAGSTWLADVRKGGAAATRTRRTSRRRTETGCPITLSPLWQRLYEHLSFVFLCRLSCFTWCSDVSMCLVD